ncbi:MAG: glycoside hydrolase family 3 N-terminal domain-containing protein [Lachnospira sp.]|nr:glycoside hydrolase family 3 N-terminal domain-containing protein [Lachnospira sp.]
MVNLKAKPFNLSDKQIEWVKNTIDGMTLDEKIGQLFVMLKAVPGVNEDMIKGTLAQSHQGGLRWQGGDKETVYLQNTTYQKNSKLPLFIAANCDDGGVGAVPEGTFVATAAECGAGEGTKNAYHLGYVSGKEASAIGCNWMFNPVVDVYKNWRNTIVNTRSFGSDPEVVLDNARAYIKGIKDANPNMACTAKHFPGDGVEELDQHLVMGVNNLSVDEWEKNFGYVYRSLIEEGLEAIMVGHIALPEMTRKLVPGIEDKDIKPATLAKELLTNLLREDMGFNGIVITDASHMVGMSAIAKRSEAVPGAIIAGCDMFLFANDIVEDMGYVKKAYEEGKLTDERLTDAVTRILGLKAHLNMNSENRNVPDKEELDCIGCEEFQGYAKEAAETCITLVKDTYQNLPVNVDEKKRVFFVYVGSTPTTKGYTGDPVKQVVIEELERAGFEVDICPSYHDLEVANGVSPMNFVKMLNHEPREEFISKHDLALVVINVKGYAQENEVRVRWSCNHSCELPWYNEEIPTIGMSLNYTNHLIDVPQLHTFINAYAPKREHIRAAIEKIIGKSEFKGTADDSVFCGRWDTRL